MRNIPYSTSNIIQPAIYYILSNYFKESISIEHLKSLCNISTVHLRNSFIKAFALSPVKYINNLKFMSAKELLSSGLYTVNEVCFLSGFNNESYFVASLKSNSIPHQANIQTNKNNYLLLVSHRLFPRKSLVMDRLHQERHTILIE